MILIADRIVDTILILLGERVLMLIIFVRSVPIAHMVDLSAPTIDDDIIIIVLRVRIYRPEHAHFHLRRILSLQYTSNILVERSIGDTALVIPFEQRF